MRVVVINHVSLDGVMQAPGRPGEDSSGAFRHGGWAKGGEDPEVGVAMGAAMGQEFSWLFGRRSYEGMLSHWNDVGGPFKDGLNGPTKYVVSTNPETKLSWPNSQLISGDVIPQIADLRAQDGGNLVVMGSGQLIRSLLPHDLVDELLLMIHPLVLGSGQQLFGPDNDVRRLRLESATASSSGLLLAIYRRR